MISLIYIPLIALLPDASFKLIQTIFWPTPIQFVLQNYYLNKSIKNDETKEKQADDSRKISNLILLIFSYWKWRKYWKYRIYYQS